MAHACNPSYLEGRYLEDHDLRPTSSKSTQDPISTNSWGQWQAPVISAMHEAEIRRVEVPGQPRQKSS
jgi:hypothetical protein